MDLGPLLGLWLQQSFVVQLTMTALNIVIFVIVYGRMIEIYAHQFSALPVATWRTGSWAGRAELSSAPVRRGFQGMLILVCVGIYAVLVQSIAAGGDPIGRYGAPSATRCCCATACSNGISPSVLGAWHRERTDFLCRIRKRRGRPRNGRGGAG